MGRLMNLRMLRVPLALAAVLAVLAAGQSPASAHYNYIYHGKDVVTIRGDHSGGLYTQGSICDQERDGHWVRAVWRTSAGDIKERDGGDAGCDSVYLIPPVYAFKICEESKGYSDWHDA